MVGNVPRLTQPITNAGNLNDCDATGCMPATTLFIPLQFWFCRNPGLALPLIALQYHEVKINLTFRAASECYWERGSNTTPALASASLWVDYIYLDTDERRRFAQVSHEYLIEQLQFTGDESVSTTSNKIKLNFNHPCKELVWVVQPDSHTNATSTNQVGGRQFFNYTDRIDESYFSGTPSDPLGGGMGGAASHSGNFPYSLPMAGGVRMENVAGMDALLHIANAGFASGGGAGIGQAAGPRISGIDGLTFTQLLYSNGSGVGAPPVAPSADNAEAPGRGWRSSLPVFDKGQNPVSTAKLQLNGHDRFAQREGRYFNLVQPYQHHENVPATGINVYSFGLKPEEHQPSGTCNFSRIDNAQLHLTLTARAVIGSRSCKVRVYAINYNVLRIMSGINQISLCRTVGCHTSCSITSMGKQCKCYPYQQHSDMVYNQLVVSH